MSIPNQIPTALKEWNVVIQAIGSGRQIILLRKGGIAEAAGGFELEHPNFVFFPTFVHQNNQMLKPEFASQVEPHAEEPSSISIALCGEVTDIFKLQSRQQMDALDEQHIWTPPLIDMRFNYRPWNPLYLLLIRAFKLPSVNVISNTPAYAGCKSWVPLDTPIDCTGAQGMLSDAAYASRRGEIIDKLRIESDR